MHFKAVLTVLTILCAIAGADIGTSTAKAHAPWKHPQGSLEAPQLHYLKFLRGRIMEERNDKCLKQPNPKSAYDIAVWNRAYYIVKWRDRSLPYVAERESRCLPTDPAAIIRYVFPDSTEDAAIRVAECESHLYPYAKNRSSSASGLFQLLSFHWYGKFNPFDPWANTRYAYRLSDAGTNWSHWVCKP